MKLATCLAPFYWSTIDSYSSLKFQFFSYTIMALWLPLCKQQLDNQILHAIGSNLIYSFIIWFVRYSSLERASTNLAVGVLVNAHCLLLCPINKAKIDFEISVQSYRFYVVVCCRLSISRGNIILKRPLLCGIARTKHKLNKQSFSTGQVCLYVLLSSAGQCRPLIKRLIKKL